MHECDFATDGLGQRRAGCARVHTPIAVLVAALAAAALTACAAGGDGPPAPLGEQRMTVTSGELVVLDAARLFGGATDSRYAWSQVDGPRIAIPDAAADRISFSAPMVSEATLLVFKLTISSRDLDAVVVITVTVLPPGSLLDGGADSAPAFDGGATGDSAPRCGDGICSAGESCGSCGADCPCVTSTVTLIASADAYVDASAPSTNFGTATKLLVDLGPDQAAYLRFDAGAVAGPIRRAVLRLYVVNPSSGGPQVRLTDSAWLETGITWDNRPAAADALAQLGQVDRGWIEVDVTSAVTAAGSYSFVLVAGSSDGADFSSREGGTPPELVLTVSDASQPAPDAAQPAPDAALPAPDAALPAPDAALPAPDAALPAPDAALPAPDAALPAPDAALPAPDSGCSGCAPILVGAGDIANSGGGAELTAQILDALFAAPGGNGAIFTAGDNAYPDGTLGQLQSYFGPTWGRHLARIRPVAGNHEYHVSGARDYFDYFGAAAGEAGKGWYSYDLGGWHIIALNGNCSDVGGCNAGSPQYVWLQNDLQAHPSACTLAYVHNPRWSSGYHGGSTRTAQIWTLLYQHDAELVLSGHDHDYERFAPQDPSGKLDSARGIRQFVVGTGGGGFSSIGSPTANSEVLQDNTYGVLKLTLHPAAYDWEFIPAKGSSFSDSGTTACH